MVTKRSDLTKALMSRPGFAEGYDEALRHQKLGALLRVLREEKGLSQLALAELSHVDQGDISRFEAGKWGKRGISYEMLDRILPVLGLRLEHRVEPESSADLSSRSRQAIKALGATL